MGALDFLGGGTQKRAVGIAVGEYYGDKIGMRSLIQHVFRAQILHLEKGNHHTDNSPDIVERQNYIEIQRILERWKTPKKGS